MVAKWKDMGHEAASSNLSVVLPQFSYGLSQSDYWLQRSNIELEN